MPVRIQRKRKAGEPGMPKGAIYVGRPSRWGNPCYLRGAHYVVDEAGYDHYCAPGEARGVAVRLFREALVEDRLPFTTADLGELAGHDLACWCPLDQPCHADVLLELANGGA